MEYTAKPSQPNQPKIEVSYAKSAVLIWKWIPKNHIYNFQRYIVRIMAVQVSKLYVTCLSPLKSNLYVLKIWGEMLHVFCIGNSIFLFVPFEIFPKLQECVNYPISIFFDYQNILELCKSIRIQQVLEWRNLSVKYMNIKSLTLP